MQTKRKKDDSIEIEDSIRGTSISNDNGTILMKLRSIWWKRYI